MKVLLINPPQGIKEMFGVGEDFVQKYEPLGLLYVASTAKAAGYDVDVIDAYAEGQSLDDLKLRIQEIEPKVVGISTLTCCGEAVYNLGRWIKSLDKGILVVLGNIHASVYATEYLYNYCCDVVVHGDGEIIFKELLDQVAGNGVYSALPGISYIDAEGKVRRNYPDAIVDDVDQVPLPARELVQQDLYNLEAISNRFYVGHGKAKTKTMMTSRGCPRRCSFCAVHGARTPRFNSALKVMQELEVLVRDYGATYVLFEDALFMADQKRLLEICKLIRSSGLNIQWGCQGHVGYMSPEIVRAMNEAGCFEISLGIESGVQRLLDNVNKGITLDGVRNAVNMIRENSNIHVEGLFIIGLPGEKYDDSLQTISFAKSLPLDMAQFSILSPYPGSPLFDELKEKNRIDTGIRENNQLEPSVWRRYSSYICFTGTEPIWVTEDLDAVTLIRLQKKALRGFYLRPGMILKHLKRIKPGNIHKIFRIALKGFF